MSSDATRRELLDEVWPRKRGSSGAAAARDSMAVALEISSVAARASWLRGGRVCEAAARGSATAARQIPPVAA